MHAFLIITTKRELGKQKAEKLASKYNALLVPFSLLKIADVRELSTVTRLSNTSPIAFFIEQIEEASIDALNAFLKQLEEPHLNLMYILTASSEERVLGTIVSRCQVVRVVDAGVKLEHPRGGFGFPGMTIGEQFLVVDKIKKREEAIEFVKEIVTQLHQTLILENDNHKSFVISHKLRQASKTLTALEKNGNVTIQLSRLVVEMNKKQ